MTFSFEIPDELVPVVAGILRARELPDDDGMTEVNLMRRYQVTPEKYGEASRFYEAIVTALENGGLQQQ